MSRASPLKSAKGRSRGLIAFTCYAICKGVCAVAYRLAVNTGVAFPRCLQTPTENAMSIAHRELLKICNACGEIFDANIEIEAQHHDQPEHAPLLPLRKQWRRAPIMVARAA